MVVQTRGLWSLVWGRPEIDPSDLARAVAEQAGHPSPDFRTRLLIRDSVDALEDYWGRSRLNHWLERCPTRARIEAIRREDLGEAGFTTIKERLMDKVDPEVVRHYFDAIGRKLNKRVRIAVGGSIALIMPGYLARSTEDIDVVDEVPQEIRSQHSLLADLKKRFGLLLGHFQSHYLPSGWDQRLHYLDTFDELQVYLVDVYDVFLSKLFSIREKDIDDLRMLLPQLDKEKLTLRFKETTASALASEDLRKRAADNWNMLFGEPLPQ